MALINIASDKQLFADNYLIESLKDARQVMNPAQKLESNPVLWPEKPWEGDYIGVSNVWFDHADQIFKMWYRPATHRAYLDADGKLAADAPADDDPITACLAFRRMASTGRDRNWAWSNTKAQKRTTFFLTMRSCPTSSRTCTKRIRANATRA